MFKLVIQDDEGKTTVVPLIRDEITIGRKEGNTIRLTERNVSRRHARIMRNNGEVHIEDLGSYNGIRVNNSRIAERVSLRVSDQVQIGDYKLYLKAEGVEQVDDARTMPIERVDAGAPATEVMAAVAAAAPAPAPVPAPAPPPAPLVAATGPQMIGNPNRTLVAIADTDPQGRPVATAATVAALSAPVGYGKLCVVSSNFAGKEYELSRPQMIVGRTDENDIVVNHRSISRNHAKLVREPETGRYTISDLQSSNGVRVNGQDYGKVELRRGDVVDLGHVRLRFVEPGEDFVFARDAVITDVPDSGSKKGLVIAVVLGVVVVGAVAAFMAFKSSGTEDKQAGKPGSDRTDLGTNNGTDVAIAGSGSNGVTVPVDVPIDAPPQVPTVVVDKETQKISARCNGLKAKRNWPELQTCGNELAAHDQNAGQDLATRASVEMKNAQTNEQVVAALKKPNLVQAAAAVNRIPDDSVYAAEAKAAYDNAERSLDKEYRAKLKSSADAHRCGQFDSTVAEARKIGLATTGSDLRCEPNVAVDHLPDHKNPGSGSADHVVVKDPVIPPPPPPCDSIALKAKGDDEYAAGNFPGAMATFKRQYDCKRDVQPLARAYQSACRAQKFDDAKRLFQQLPPQLQNSLVQMCLPAFDPRK